MTAPLPLPQLLDEWFRWADWVSSPNKDESLAGELIAWGEFNWAVNDHPELAWQAILAAIAQPRMKPHLGTLAAGPLEDLLSLHGKAFIERVEAEATASPEFARLLGGVWQSSTSEEIWSRVVAVRDCRGWDGAPRNEA
jgi:hypothetical protein